MRPYDPPSFFAQDIAAKVDDTSVEVETIYVRLRDEPSTAVSPAEGPPTAAERISGPPPIATVEASKLL